MTILELILAMYILTAVVFVIFLLFYFNFKKEIMKFEDKWLEKYHELIYIVVEKIDKLLDKTFES